MAEILVKLGDQGLDKSAFRNGDPLAIKDDGEGWGRCEDIRVWTAEGNDPAFWPGCFFIIQITDATAAQVRMFVDANANLAVKRLNAFDTSGISIVPGQIVKATRAQALARLRVKT